MAINALAWSALELLKRDTTDADGTEPDAGQNERLTSWSLFILICLLISALIASYVLQTRKIQAIHETVMSIFAGMIIGLILRLTANDAVLGVATFDDQVFFNLLLPPIILGAGYELHQANFFRSIGPILTFAFAGTFISAVVLGVIIYVWTRLNLDGVSVDFIDAMAVGATLSATDPVTILAIFNAYKVDPKLYTVIFGESILNDAIAIVLFETAQRYKAKGHNVGFIGLFESIWTFLFVFFGSLVIGVLIGMTTSLLLKLTYLRRFPKTESCIVFLIAYASYFFSNAIQMSGIVSLLFCGMCMKHYAYHNMSRRTQLTTKFVFQVTAQLSENFIFIYLGLSLFTDRLLVFKPLFIMITIVGICVARYAAVFPLSRAINAVIRYKQRRNGVTDAPDELSYSHQVMLFWAGLRGAVGVALAAGLNGSNAKALRATVLIVVVLTVIIFGGTTARMLEIMNVKTGVVEEIDSDDEFDIEYIDDARGTFSRKAGNGIGHTPRPSGNGFVLGDLDADLGDDDRHGSYSSGNINGSTSNKRSHGVSRRESGRNDLAERNLLSPDESTTPSQTDDEDLVGDLDLPPNAPRRETRSGTSPLPPSHSGSPAHYPLSGRRNTETRPPSSGGSRIANATGAITQLISGLSEDPASALRMIDEDFIKPHLLLDPGSSHGHGHGNSGGNSNV